MSSAAAKHKPCTGLRLCRACAAAAAGVSIDLFDQSVRPHLPIIRIGARVGFLRDDLVTWLRSQRESTCAAPSSSSAPASGTTRSPSQASAHANPRIAAIARKLRLSLQEPGTPPSGAAVLQFPDKP